MRLKDLVFTFLAILVMGVMATGGACVVRAQQGDPKPFTIIEWRVNAEFGPSVLIADYIKPAGYEPYSRKLYLYLDPSNFNEENLKRLFLGLAADYGTDKDLFIRVYSDKETLKENIGPDLLNYHKEPNNTKGKQHEEVAPSRKKVYWAFYARTLEREGFDYSLDPDKNRVATVVIRDRVIPYTGNLDSDLVLAALEGDTEKVKASLADGANINAVRTDGNTALMLAVWKRNDAIIRLLLEKDADINAKNLEGWTALMNAIANKDADTARALLDRGVEVNAKNKYGDSALTLAISKGWNDFVRVLLERGADINAQDGDGNTPLNNAILSGGNRAIIDLLLAVRTNTQLRNKKDQTALMLAEQMAKDHQRVVDLVLAEAAKGYAKITDPEVIKIFAEQDRWIEIIELLKKK